MRSTLAEFKTTHSWPAILNMESSDPRWLQLLNLASERLLNMAMWMGTTQRYAICVKDACLTWGRQFQTIIAMDVCDQPIQLRSQWHEFLENGPGLARLKCCNAFNGYDRGSGFAMFDDVTIPSRIRLYTQFPADAGKTITVRGLDSNYQPVLTNNGNTDGEVMALTGTFVDSATIWGKQTFHHVIKQKTKGYVRAYSWDATLPTPPASPGPNDTPLKPLAIWEPSETLPDYRRSYIPSLAGNTGCCGDGVTIVGQNDPAPTCRSTRVTVIAKMKFISIENDLDFLPIGNPSALGLAMKAVMLEQRGDTSGAQVAMQGMLDPVRHRYVGGAVPYLEEELDSWQGAGVVDVLRLESGMTDRVNILNLI